MSLPLIVAGVFFLVSAQGQDICNYDPDAIFFENSQLEKLKQSILRGDCSQPSVVWKMVLDSALQQYLGDDADMDSLSSRDLEVLDKLGSVQRGSRVRFPDDPDYHRDESFPSNQGARQSGTDSSYLHRFSNRNRLFDQRRFYPVRDTMKRQVQNPDLLRDNPQSERQSKSFDDNKQETSNNLFRSNFENLEFNTDFINRNSSPSLENRVLNGPKIGQSLFRPNIKSGLFRPTKLLFRPVPQTKQQMQRPQPSQRPTGDLLRPNDQSSIDTDQIRPNQGRGPTTQRVPVVQKTTPSPVRPTTLPGPPAWPTAPSLCVRMCPNTPEYNPVCGSDRVTYANPGRLRCEQQCGKANVNLNFYGICGTSTTTQPSTTTRTTVQPSTTTSRSTRTKSRFQS